MAYWCFRDECSYNTLKLTYEYIIICSHLQDEVLMSLDEIFKIENKE